MDEEDAKTVNPILAPSEEDLTDPSHSGASTFTREEIFEQKCLLVNEEFNRMGMGKYQWRIWLLCGFGYFIDLLWAQAFGLVLSPLQQELGFPANKSGNISVAFSSGLTAGAFVWGVLVDIIGRRWAFNLTCLCSAAFGLGLGGCNTYTSFLVVTAFLGFGVGGNIPIDTTICLEFLPQNRRFLLAMLSIFQPVGVVLCSVIAYGFIPNYSCSPNFSEANPLLPCNSASLAPGEKCCTKESNMGWRYLLYTLGGITLGIFLLRFVVFHFEESPKFLLYRGRDRDAVEVIERIAKKNKTTSQLTLAHLEAIDASQEGGVKPAAKLSVLGKIRFEASRLSLLFAGWTRIRITALVWLTYICDFWGFTLAGTYLPTILAHKNASIHLDLRFTYRSYVYIYLPGIIGVMLGSLMYAVPQIGRKWAMVVSSALMGISIFVFSAVNSEASNIGLNIMEYFFQSMFNAILYGWTPEIFPAPIRGTACGVASFWGRLFGIIAPLTAQSLLPDEGTIGDGAGINKVLYLAGGITLGCVLTISLLPNSMVGRQSL